MSLLDRALRGVRREVRGRCGHGRLRRARAHEDDPERALRRRAPDARADGRAQSPAGSGGWAGRSPCTSGSIPARWWPARLGAAADAAYAVTGDTVNTASRLLERGAPPARSWCATPPISSPSIAFAFEPARGAPAEGQERADRSSIACLARWRRRARLAASQPRAGRAPRRARARARAGCMAAFDRHAAGRAQVLSLVGEAGSGEVAAPSGVPGAARGSRAPRGRGRPPRGVLGPGRADLRRRSAALLRDAYGVEPGDSARGRAEKLAVGLAALGVGAEEREAMAAAARATCSGSSATTRACAISSRSNSSARSSWHPRPGGAASRRRAAVLVVEDLHWADAASVELLGAIVDRLADRPLLILLLSGRARAGRRWGPRAAHIVDPRSRPLSRPTRRGRPGRAGSATSVRLFPEHLRTLILDACRRQPAVSSRRSCARLIARGRAGPRGRGVVDAPEALRPREVPPTLQGLLLARLDRLARRRSSAAPGSRRARAPRFVEPLLQRRRGRSRRGGRGARRARRAPILSTLRGPRRYRFSPRARAGGRLRKPARCPPHGAARARRARRSSARRGSRPERLERSGSARPPLEPSAPTRRRGARYLMAAGDWARGALCERGCDSPLPARAGHA